MKEVDRTKLVPGKLYYIESLTYNTANELIVNRTHKNVGVFVNLSLVDPGFIQPWYAANFDWLPAKEYMKFENPTDVRKNTRYRVTLNYLWKFYEVHKFDIQNNMESRSTNLFLQNRIGDEHFIWS